MQSLNPLGNPLKLSLFGYGKMGQMVEKMALQRGHAIDTVVERANLAVDLKNADIVIDFTSPESVIENVQKAGQSGKNIVIGTTGWNHRMKEVEEIAKQYQIGVLYSPNFSIGVHLFLKIVAEASALISKIDGYDVAGIELHHKEKADSPSGTAKALVEAILKNWPSKTHPFYNTPIGKIEPDALQFASLRTGSIAGTHSIFFDSAADTITLTHEAKSREGFAKGAVIAAEWLHNKKGFFTLEDLLC